MVRCDSSSLFHSAAKFVDVVRHALDGTELPPLPPLPLLLLLLLSVGGCLTFQSPIELRRSQSDGGAAAAACPMSIRPSFTNTADDPLELPHRLRERSRVHATSSHFHRRISPAGWILHARRSEERRRRRPTLLLRPSLFPSVCPTAAAAAHSIASSPSLLQRRRRRRRH